MACCQEAKVIANHINDGLPMSKREYAEALYDELIKDIQAGSNFQNYVSRVLPVARFIVEKTDMPADELAKKLKTFVDGFVVDQTTYDIRLSKDIRAKYIDVGDLDAPESILSILACEFLDREHS